MIFVPRSLATSSAGRKQACEFCHIRNYRVSLFIVMTSSILLKIEIHD